jgi:hypothetical protein
MAGNYIFLRDPDDKRENLKKILLGDLLKAIKNHFTGGVWVIK